MTPASEHRKRVATMFTDMVGYSALAQRNEALALELVEVFPRFRGTAVKTIVDAFLVEFSSALEAAQCGIEIRRTLAQRNADAPADRQVQVRISVHMGGVVHRDGDVYGDGVNIASRIEPLAGARGTCMMPKQIKRFADGAIYSLAIQLREPYLGDFHGEWITAPKDFANAFRIYWDAAYQIHIHVKIGDLSH
jgi:class 3 adenylate cyclase